MQNVSQWHKIFYVLLYMIWKKKKDIPAPSIMKNLETDSEDLVTLISVDTDHYRRYYENKSVRKNLTIPMWLNQRAEEANINFSQVLKEAIKEQLNI